MKRSFLAYLFILLFSTSNLAQTNNTPYSSIGIGEWYDYRSLRSFGMGDLGIGSFSQTMLNLKNPAFGTFNKLTVFEFGVLGKHNEIRQNQNVQQSFAASPQYLAFSFPLGNYATVGAGITSFARTNYVVITSRYIPNTASFVINNFEGSGGLSQAYFSSSFRIGNHVRLGLQANYTFGTYNYEIKSVLTEGNSPNIAQKSEAFVYRTWNFKPALALLLPLENEKTLSLGLVYQSALDLKGTYQVNYLRTTSAGVPISSSKGNTPANTTVDRKTPEILQIGIGMQKRLHYSFGIDFDFYQWSGIRNADTNQTFENSFRVKAGAEYIPDINAVFGYFKRVTYRLGYSYQTYPYQINDVDLDEIKFHAGISLPMSQFFSRISLGLAYGIRNPKQNFQSSIEERYFQIMFGMTFSERWFIKRKLF